QKTSCLSALMSRSPFGSSRLRRGRHSVVRATVLHRNEIKRGNYGCQLSMRCQMINEVSACVMHDHRISLGIQRRSRIGCHRGEAKTLCGTSHTVVSPTVGSSR